MSHTQASKIYSIYRIPGHKVQLLASMRVMMYLHHSYPEAYARHHDLLVKSLKNVEESNHE